MKIAVVGATGATGRRVVKHALAQGHFVTAVARHPERLSPTDRLSIVRGDVLSPGGLKGALDGVEVVISCIGPEKNLSPGTLMSVGVASILTECKRANVRRFILQSGIGLSDGRELSCLSRFVVRISGRLRLSHKPPRKKLKGPVLSTSTLRVLSLRKGLQNLAGIPRSGLQHGIRDGLRCRGKRPGR